MTFQQVKEQYIKPPFKYWILPRGFVHGNFLTFNTIREAKAKVEELLLTERVGEYDILNVYVSKDPWRKGYMSAKILSCGKDFEWYRYTDHDFALHTAFFFSDNAVARWNPQKYQKLKEMFEKGRFDKED